MRIAPSEFERATPLLPQRRIYATGFRVGNEYAGGCADPCAVPGRDQWIGAAVMIGAITLTKTEADMIVRPREGRGHQDGQAVLFCDAVVAS